MGEDRVESYEQQWDASVAVFRSIAEELPEGAAVFSHCADSFELELVPSNPAAAKVSCVAGDDLPLLLIGEEDGAYHEMRGWRPVHEWVPHLDECVRAVVDGGYSVSRGLLGFRMNFELGGGKRLRVSHGIVLFPVRTVHYEPYVVTSSG